MAINSNYKEPQVVISQQLLTPAAQIDDTTRIPCLVAQYNEYVLVSKEAVVRSSTGYVDNLVYTSTGITQIDIVESKIGLNDYKTSRDWNLVSGQIVWTSTGLIPSSGVTYYVTYRRTRSESLGDYNFKYLYSSTDAQNYCGYTTTDNHNGAWLLDLGFNRFKNQVIAVVPVKPPYALSDFQAALAKTRNQKVNTILPLSSNYTFQLLVRDNVNERSLPTSKRERMAYMGPAIGTVKGNEPSPASTSVKGMAEAFLAETCVYVGLPRAKYTFTPQSTGTETTMIIDGAGIANSIGLYRDSFRDPSYVLMRNQFTWFSLFEEDRDEFFIDESYADLGKSGAFQIGPLNDNLAVPIAIDELTTDVRSDDTSSIAVITAKHYNTYTIRKQLDATFLPTKILNEAVHKQNVQMFLTQLFSQLVAAGSMESYTPSDIQVSVGKSLTDPNVVNKQATFIFYKYKAIRINKYIYGSYIME